MSLFQGDIFGSGGMGALGILPTGADRIDATLSRWRGQFPGIPSDSELGAKTATHYTTRVLDSTSQEFTFYDSTGRVAVGPLRISHRLADVEAMWLRVRSAGTSKEDGAAPHSGDGLLPSGATGTPTWLPWALVGGGVLVAGGIAWALTRTPKRAAVAANRHKRRRRRTR